MRSVRVRPVLVVVLAVLLGASCRGGVDAPAANASGPKPTTVSFGAYAFRDTIGTVFPSVPVQVTDAAGRPVRGVVVQWGTKDSAASVTPTTSVTDATGVATTRWQLGAKTGSQALVAVVAGIPPATAYATVAGGFATQVVFAPDRLTIGAAGDTVGVTVGVYDRGGNGNAASQLMFTWTTSAPDVATVGDANGSPYPIVAHAPGTAVVTAQVYGLPTHGTLSVDVPAYTQVWTANGRTCGTTAGGVLACWGDNLYGALGDGTTTSRASPIPVAAGANVVQVGMGEYSICARTAAGQISCTGFRTAGSRATLDPAPAGAVPVTGAPAFTDVSAGDGAWCGVTSAGAAWCWGADAPTPVAGGTTFARVRAGWFGHTCGVTRNGAAYCWGLDDFGQIGTDQAPVPCRANASLECVPEPAPVAGGLTFTDVQPGNDATCGLTTTGDAYCWGRNFPNPPRTHPTLVAPGLKFTALANGSAWSMCGLTAAGAVYCWDPALGQPPRQMQSPYTFTTLDVGAASQGSDQVRVCGIVRNGGAACVRFVPMTQ